jgi:hypothetical protein
MENCHSRREFIESGAVAGGCLLLLCPLLARRGAAKAQPTPEAYVFDETMGYCCAECTPAKCKWLSDDMEFKSAKARELSEKYGKKIAPEEITCSRCRIPANRTPAAIKGCPTRACVIERNLLSCAHCRELPECKRANPVTRARALAIQRVVLGESS